MQNTISLLDKYKQACRIDSDNACAVSLGITRAAVSRWRNGLGHPDADSVERMCIATGENLARWLPLIEAERARSPSVRKTWLKLAQAAAVLVLTVAAHPATATAAHHAGADSSARNPAASVYYVKFSKWVCRLGMRLALALARLHGPQPCPAPAPA